MIFVSYNYRGALNIAAMRGFEDVDKARDYYKKLAREHGNGAYHGARGYELFEGKEPKLIWSAAKDKKVG
jgi:hypothetical protein